jgi:hypothetical protein
VPHLQPLENKEIVRKLPHPYPCTLAGEEKEEIVDFGRLRCAKTTILLITDLGRVGERDSYRLGQYSTKQTEDN